MHDPFEYDTNLDEWDNDRDIIFDDELREMADERPNYRDGTTSLGDLMRDAILAKARAAQ